ncbi:MAG: hypothetical protein MJ156_03070, partial [Alphaproteobacteria bacterium]|nr:hypothetical protein [Alphaproteobacteria bacterium]
MAASVRDANTIKRTNLTNTIANTTTKGNVKVRSSNNSSKQVVNSRVAVKKTDTNKLKKPTRRSSLVLRTSSNGTKKLNVLSRAATKSSNEEAGVQQTKIGVAYEQCKTAFFTCMDQFCKLKNDSYRRCSCSDKVYSFDNITSTLNKASEKLTEFSENLDVVGLTKEQAISMKTASEGEIALTEDKSSSKQLLQAIMNSINGNDTKVGGKYSDLNSINLNFDSSNAFGTNDTGQILASYNGAALYTAVFPQCREAVLTDCNDAALQRAVNAYLMAIEQDCNTVNLALNNQKKQLNTAIHEESIMLDVARVENRQKHNIDDVSTCLANVEQIIESEDVCGKNYYKCLDNGQYIDATTGAPIDGIVDFYKLGQLLTFNSNVSLDKQKLSTIPDNRFFVQAFESKTKQFVEDALERCSEKAEVVWKDYLDMALLNIYYAQQAKIAEIQQSCFDLVASCYDKQNTSITQALTNLTGKYADNMQPDKIVLSEKMCSNYIDSCNNLFGADIIDSYLKNRDKTDVLATCKNVAQQCFSQYGGDNYENFYNPYSGIFADTNALDWFSLYDDSNKKVISPCAQMVKDIDACSQNLESVFGGFDKKQINNSVCYTYSNSDNNSESCVRELRSSGVATEVYYKITDILSKQCETLGGYFVEPKFAKAYGYLETDYCKLDTTNSNVKNLDMLFKFVQEEDVCPSNYRSRVDVNSWGACSCWENGGRRSKNGAIQICKALLPSVAYHETDAFCEDEVDFIGADGKAVGHAVNPPQNNDPHYWCTQQIVSSSGKVCPTLE